MRKCSSDVVPGESESHGRLDRLLKRDLGPAVSATGRGTWVTSSSLPHEISLRSQAGVDLVRIAASGVIGVKKTKALLDNLNYLNVKRSWRRLIRTDGVVLGAAEMPVTSSKPRDLVRLVECVLCTIRLDAPDLQLAHGGVLTLAPPGGPIPDLERDLHNWADLLAASGTATEGELSVYLDAETGANTYIDLADPDVPVVVIIGKNGIGQEWPFTLKDMLDSVLR